MILAGASAIVTGGAVRIGREIGLALAGAGANVCLQYRNSEQQARQTAVEIEALGARAAVVQADLEYPARAAATIVDHARAQFGTVHILVNSAAIFEAGTLLSTDEAHWDRHFAVNLKAPFFLTQAFLRQLPESTTGAVVNLIDWRGLRPLPGHAAYTQTKAALAAQTVLLAQELGPRVRVNGVAPGPILPPPGESRAEFERRASDNPLGRVGAPGDIAEAVLFLLRSSFITGEILHVTGGAQFSRSAEK